MLDTIITKIDNWQNKTAAEIHSELSTVVKTKTPVRYTWIGLRNLFPDKYLTWKISLTIAIDANKDNIPLRVALEDVMEMLSTGDGPDFSNDILQAQIDQLVQMKLLSQDDGDLLKALGYKSETKWQILGGSGNIPTEQVIEEAKQARIEKNELVKKCDAVRNVIDPLLVLVKYNTSTAEIVGHFERLYKENIGE